MSSVFSSLGLIGGGAWGTALALNAQRAGRDVTLWARSSELVAALNAGDAHPHALSGITLPKISATQDMSALSHVEGLILVVPAQALREVLTQLKKHFTRPVPLLLCCKGIERSTLLTMAQVAEQVWPEAPLAVLSGPSFASDVANNLPTAITLASLSRETGQAWINSIGRESFRPYYSNDLIGAEIGGAVKNVLAIACGIAAGMSLGQSAAASLITRGFAEMNRLGLAMGARAETMAGLSGLGDLVLTCSSNQSRNMSFGFALGQGQSIAEIFASRKQVTEGAATAPSLTQLSGNFRVNMPICEAVASILSHDNDVNTIVARLLARPFKDEGFAST